MGVTAANWPRHRSRPALEVFYYDFALVFLASSAMVSANFVGSLPGCEIVVLVMLPFLLLRHAERLFRSEYRWFYLFLGLWLFGTVGGDVYLGSTAARSLKGLARVVFLGLDFATLVILINGRTRGVIAFTLGFIPTMLYIAFQFRADFLVAWKFGLGYAITLLALVFASYFYERQRNWAYISIFAGVAFLNLVLASRSQIAIDLVSLVLVLPIWRRKGSSRGGASKIFVALSLACAAAFVANQAVKFGVNHDLFDEGITDKFQTQEEGKLGVLVGGRPESLVAIRAIMDNPIVGHGSFAVDPKYNRLQQDIEYENGYTATDVAPDEVGAGIPAHSHLTQSWVESGVFGGIFWIFGLLFTLRGIITLIARGSPMAPLFSFLLVGFMWDILYSPMGSFDRLWGAFAFLITYSLLKAAKLEDSFARPPGITNKQVIRPRLRPIWIRSGVRSPKRARS